MFQRSIVVLKKTESHRET